MNVEEALAISDVDILLETVQRYKAQRDRALAERDEARAELKRLTERYDLNNGQTNT